MENKFFKVSSIIGDVYDLIIPPSSLSEKSEISQSEVDEIFILKIQNWRLIKKSDLAEINNFLDYQLKWHAAEPIEFITHIDEVLKTNKDRLAVYGIITRHFHYWINLKKIELSSKPHIKKKSTKRPEIKFEDVFKDKVSAKKILKILEVNDVIDSNHEWGYLHKAKSSILGLIQVLKDKKYLRIELKVKGSLITLKQTTLGIIFREKFNLEISKRSLSKEPNNVYVRDYENIIPDQDQLI